MDAYAERNQILIELGFKDYPAYLRSPLWKSIREQKLAQDPECYACARRDGQAIMQVHHGAYTLENLSGMVPSDLWSVCSRCHRWIEITKDGYKRNPQQATEELFKIRKIYRERSKFKDDNRLKLDITRRGYRRLTK
jgi:5-methylcytosine-specific restriction endonuclease McrA